MANLFDKPKWNKRFATDSAPLIGDAVKTGWESGADFLNLDIEFDIKNPDVTEFIKNKTIVFSKQVNQTTSDKLNEDIKAIIEEGGTVEQIREKIQERVTAIYTFSKASRARMIARTEMIGSNNGGALLAYRKSGVVGSKEWLTSRDKLVRHSHMRANKQVRKLDKPFRVGGSRLMHPGDSSLGASADEIINCRCIVLPRRSRKGMNAAFDFKIWKAFITPTIKQERRFANLMIGLFAEQEKEVLKNVKGLI